MKTNEFVNGVSKELLRAMGVSGGGDGIRQISDITTAAGLSAAGKNQKRDRDRRRKTAGDKDMQRLRRKDIGVLDRTEPRIKKTGTTEPQIPMV